MIPALLIFLGGLTASAFFSGIETGLYRVPRVRLVLDGVAGSWVARFLLWLTNHPGVFVATVLVGNNLANYVASFGILAITAHLFGDDGGAGVQLAMTVLFTPVLFIYGELLPKSVFFAVPFRLLMLAGPVLLAITILLSPLSLLLWLASLGLQKISGQTPLRVFPGLARRELRKMLHEGSELGLLTPMQRAFSENILAYGGTAIRSYCMPVRGLRMVASDAGPDEFRVAAARSIGGIVPVVHPSRDRIVGYCRVSDIAAAGGKPERLRALVTLAPETSQAVAVSRMLAAKCDLARVIDSDGNLVGVILQQRLLGQMMQQE